ncbi:MAG: lipopolysaccharide biosynthesis protein [Candidatus Cloacimonetes bacterium]|nr:lipopolysaccharide biosynthesis protein [Candidatus Cloacimonadota bacterium]
MSIKNKTISGLKWSMADNISNQIVQFIVGLVLARLLSPSEYGIIGIVLVFIAISETFVQSGLGSALIRKQNCSDIDYNTMFYSNVCLGIVFFSVLYASSGFIARFYDNPPLKLLVRVMAINLIINSFGMVETAILIKNIDFKRQTKISLVSGILSGVMGIYFAAIGYGYWSLVIRTMCKNIITVVMLHLSSSWKPKLAYSMNSFRELFGFGIKLLGAALIHTVYQNIYKLVIGKSFSPAELGYFSRAQQFEQLPSSSLQLTTQRVTYPVLSNMTNDLVALKRVYKKMIKLTFYLTCIIMLAMIVNAREIILILIGQQWTPAIPYLQIVCLSGMLYPLHSLNLNMLNALGRSDLYLKLEIYKKILVVPVIIIGVKYGMIILLLGMLVNSCISYLLNSMFSSKLLQYSTMEQIRDVSQTFAYVVVVFVITYFVGMILPESLLLSLFIKSGVIILCLVSEGYLFKKPEFMELKELGIEQFKHHIAPLLHKK